MIQLKRLLKQVEFAMAQQDIRYYLNQNLKKKLKNLKKRNLNLIY